ncbi:MAG TPA: CinA family protein [Candidatus Acidoferrales bacterium]|jgi:PncC family amidohydrolase|nr:CinA family protein [Candidatus Acidoferrales bacterium]
MTEDTAPILADAFPEVRTLGDALRAAHRTVAVAESCTGGLLGAALTAFPGSSDFLLGGVIAYADDAKVTQLGVTREALSAHGAVSEEVATQMADGARLIFGADIGLAITGVAGPGAEDGKPAGLVFVALAADDGNEVTRLDGDQGREGNRARAVREALRLCQEHA